MAAWSPQPCSAPCTAGDIPVPAGRPVRFPSVQRLSGLAPMPWASARLFSQGFLLRASQTYM